ncbi:hypothetical protein L596_026428 [Steinernema carpocapsae]|uniref:Uncharacterized protein n=1 Tax=Steinernema carpocapsae TaxID=34508 RepID=A0A4U5M2B8_STECR|nr:hypothetical protein L596_026428 [Steinernema carpocapsae]
MVTPLSVCVVGENRIPNINSRAGALSTDSTSSSPKRKTGLKRGQQGLFPRRYNISTIPKQSFYTSK